ncbi:MAG: hydroxymethylbilane synthase [Opitutaceae bacterium]
MKPLVIATRKSPLALAQSNQVADQLRTTLGVQSELLKMVTTGDRQTEWSLEKKGGKGLFTSELEHALVQGEADLAVHSTKDLPGDMPEGLEIAGYLPREDPRDVLVIRTDVDTPKLVATGSPRRRLQLSMMFPDATFTEIRGNVDTRLRKIAEVRVADATVLAAAGLRRLGIPGWPGLEFRPFALGEMVPAVGQAAIAIQCRKGEGERWRAAFDASTSLRVSLERAFQRALGGGCHTAVAVHATPDSLYFFHEEVGQRTLPLGPDDFAAPDATAGRLLRHFGFNV